MEHVHMKFAYNIGKTLFPNVSADLPGRLPNNG